MAVDTATLVRSASLLVDFLSEVGAADADVPALVCLGPEATLVAAAAATRMADLVDLFVPSADGQLGRPRRGQYVVIVDGPTWPDGMSALLATVEYTFGAPLGLGFVHEPHDRTLVERLAASGCPARALNRVERDAGPQQDLRLEAIVPGQLDETGTGTVLVVAADGSLTEVPPQPSSSWPALAWLENVRRTAQLHLPAESAIFRPTAKPPLQGADDVQVRPEVARSLRQAVLGDVATQDLDELAGDLQRSIGASEGLGIAVYASGKQLACRVCANARDLEHVARTVRAVRQELQQAGKPSANPSPPVLLLSLLRSPHTTSAAAVRDGRLRLGEHTLIARGRSGPAFVLAHVPCFMNWTARQALGMLERKAGTAAPRLWISPTRTLWVRHDGTVEDCTGGLPDRRASLRTVANLSAEIDLVAGHLSEQVDDRHHAANAYYPLVDKARDGSRARRAIALSALLRAEGPGLQSSGLEGSGLDRTVDRAVSMLAALAEEAWPNGTVEHGVEHRPAQLLELAHILLAMTLSPCRPEFDRHLPRYVEHLQACLGPAGRVVAALPPSAPELPYLPGVLLTALATCRSRRDVPTLWEDQLAAAVRDVRGRFGRDPRWPEVWWQLRAWSAIHAFWPDPAVEELLTAMVRWTGSYQLASGAFLTWEWPTAPCFQTACVAEGLVQASRTLASAGIGSSETSALASKMVTGALEFCSSLVLDNRHADLWPVPSRAVRGVRSWHGGIELRSDAAGHYLHALLDHRESVAIADAAREPSDVCLG